MFQICTQLQVFYRALIGDQNHHHAHSHFAKDPHHPYSFQYLAQAHLQHPNSRKVKWEENRNAREQVTDWLSACMLERERRREKECFFTSGISISSPSTSRLTCHGKSAQALSTISLAPSLAYRNLFTNCT